MAVDKNFGVSFIIGLVLLPVSAIAAVAMSGPSAAEPTTTIAVATTRPAETTATAAVAEGLTDTDIWQACVPDAASLLEKEVAGTITPIEDAALDALRAICEAEGMPLDGPPAPPPITQTVVVAGPRVASAAPAASDTSGSTTGTSTPSELADEETIPALTQPQELAGQSQYLAQYAIALAAINEAIAAGGEADKIDEAREQLSEAEGKAVDNDFWGALEKAMEAEEQAHEAISEWDDD